MFKLSTSLDALKADATQPAYASTIVKADMSASPDDKTTRFVASTAVKDRHGDIILQQGWKVEDYLSNPVFLWAHDSRAPPIGRVVNLELGEALIIDVEWAPTPFAQEIASLYRGGFMSAVSVGFSALKYDWLDDGGIVFLEQELREVSAVPIPANPEALAVRSASGRTLDALLKGWAQGVLKASDDARLERVEALLKGLTSAPPHQQQAQAPQAEQLATPTTTADPGVRRLRLVKRG